MLNKYVAFLTFLLSSLSLKLLDVYLCFEKKNKTKKKTKQNKTTKQNNKKKNKTKKNQNVPVVVSVAKAP